MGPVVATAAAHISNAGFPLLTALIFVPGAGAVLMLLTPGRRPELTRTVGYVTSAGFGFAVAAAGRCCLLLRNLDNQCFGGE